LQQHLILDEENGTHNTTYTNKQISDMLGISLNSVKKYNTELIQHDILHETTLLTRTDGGFNLVKKSFDLEKLGQVILLKVKEHEEKLNKHEQEIADLKQIVENNEVEKEVLFRRITALERIVGLQNNTYIEKFSTTM
jgi:DNA-binding Lrp family transcriptional regulator